jgi:uncharacterized membrane protein
MMNETLLYAMASLFIAAGAYHFVRPKFYLRIMPRRIPWHKLIVNVSGACEIILGILLLPAVTRSFAAWGIIILLILVFPANIQMALNFHRKKNPYLWIAILRLPLQFVLIGWAFQYTAK